MKRRKDKHWSDVKARLEKKGSSLSMIARRLKISPQAVAIVRDKVRPRIQTEIAKELSTKPSVLWPSRYHHPNGPAIPAADWRRKNSRAKLGLLVKNRKAA